ncbi:hypothetical protein VTJ04DRAFT_4917 [Mycothermus thermophilus]|uniref:uncharacterized protein n=1 Tax=Humicola insolens TaxID=85995 RepID=UPI0037442720
MDPTRARELFPSSRDRWVHVVKDPLSSGRKGKALDVRSTFPFCKLGLGIRFPRSTLGGSAFQGRGKHGDWFPPAFGGDPPVCNLPTLNPDQQDPSLSAAPGPVTLGRQSYVAKAVRWNIVRVPGHIFSFQRCPA